MQEIMIIVLHALHLILENIMGTNTWVGDFFASGKNDRWNQENTAGIARYAIKRLWNVLIIIQLVRWF